MADATHEKSTIDKSDYEGLQLDTRAKDSTEKDLDTSRNVNSPRRGPIEYSDEKNFITESEAREAAGLDDIPESATSTLDPSKPSAIDDHHGPPQPKAQRICGLKRRYFWTFFGLVLAMIVIAAVVGGAVAGTKHSSSSTSTPSTITSSNSSTNTTANSTVVLTESSVMVGSPLELVAYTTNTSGASDAGSDQAFRLYFQSVHGNVKEATSNNIATPWTSANPIFTDACNNTGLAVITYMNTTVQQSSIYYVGTNGLLQEKRNYAPFTAWEPGSLDSMNIQAVGSIPIPQANPLQNPSNSWDSYRMAAAYSTRFHGGPAARLFYHSVATDGTARVQELVWNQTADSWALGATLTDPYPNSHLAVTIDNSTQLLRLFYSSGNLTLGESWLNISDPNGVYREGVNIPNILAHNDADLAVVAINGSALVYHYADLGILGIRELNISGTPGSQNNQESYNLSSEVIVAQPALYNNQQLSLYQPIGATVTTAPDLTPKIFVFWAEQNVNSSSGYASLMTVSRPVSDTTWPSSSYGNSTSSVPLPLGDNNT